MVILCHAEHLFLHWGQFRDQKSLDLHGLSFIIRWKWFEQDLCRKCAKTLEKNPPKHECACLDKYNNMYSLHSSLVEHQLPVGGACVQAQAKTKTWASSITRWKCGGLELAGHLENKIPLNLNVPQNLILGTRDHYHSSLQIYSVLCILARHTNAKFFVFSSVLYESEKASLNSYVRQKGEWFYTNKASLEKCHRKQEILAICVTSKRYLIIHPVTRQKGRCKNDMFLSLYFLSTLDYFPINPENDVALGIYNDSVYCTVHVLVGFGSAARHLLFKFIFTRQTAR